MVSERRKKPPRRSQALHVVGQQLSGREPFRIRDDVPLSRADCKDGPRPCPHVRCKWHLWIQHGDARPGRRWRPNTHPATTLRPIELEAELPVSCALDIADSVRDGKLTLTVAEIGEAIGIRKTQTWETLASALRKLAVAGLTLRDFLEGTPGKSRT